MTNLQVNFVNIGQGDCTLIVCPDDTRIMIDYGSHYGALGKDCITLKQAKDAAEDEVKQLVNMKLRNRPLTYAKDLITARKAASTAKTAYEVQKNSDNQATTTEVNTALAAFLPTAKKIDYVILTHHDSDHYNKVAYLKLKNVTFGKVYYSGPIQKYQQLRANYPSTALVDEYISVTINGEDETDQTMIESDGAVTILCQTDRATIYTQAAAPPNPEYSIDILASNVQANLADQGTDVKNFHFGATEINGRSIVTMITYGTDNILIMGDATTETETFLVTTYGAALQSNTLRVGHHGSDSSSSLAFINNVQPLIAIISCSIVNSYNLPTASITNRYITYFTGRGLTDENHELVAYADISYLDRYTESNITQPLWQTWSLEETNTGYSGS